jgi:hypothetical protein
MKKSLELRIGAKVVEAGIVLQVKDPNGADLVSALKRGLSFLFVTDGGPGRRHIVVRDGCTVRFLHHGCQVSGGFGSFAGPR